MLPVLIYIAKKLLTVVLQIRYSKQTQNIPRKNHSTANSVGNYMFKVEKH